MTQLAETLFSNTPPIAWPQLLTLQSTEIKHVTYCQGQFNISAQELPLSSRNYYYLTLISPSITSEALLNLLSTLSQRLQSTQDSRDIILYPPANYALNNNVLTDKQVPLEKAVNQGDIIVLGFTTLSDELQQQFKDTLVSWSNDYHVDYALSQTLPSLKQPGVVLMDMDSTTIQIECIDEIAKLAGVGEQVAAVTARAMNGELDFSESLRSRVATLTNCPEAVLTQVADAMPLMPGLELLIATLHQANWKVAIASGGFTYFAKRLQDDLGFDAVYANELEIVDGILTGKVIGNIVDAQVKADTLQALAQEYQITPQQTVAIGDGANDLIMLKSAALGVAIHAKPIVQQQAQVALNYHDLEGLVGLLQAANCVDASWS
ncbi:phosphoserine phosphatase SerB [Moritella viscosa]|uniref:Phosphoserine phosphatase n=1 Tax=Moritella viscosa TaxID=80854 RepID=A0A1L0B880_9GAMM|nr:phosphoserine phosphatase SerB [Moritella viscosa]SGY98905.1 Phosphoserine phosphatase [Moritella viscosa]SHO05560.1 Phosphoserine phosphatase [Moritella viscosa]SHO05561.1 Phosphoserine phosphatase [Moritella viscosa]SHO08829.1 Phosphoserine phosphatase [Moritella viscosa]SHO12754.1 Phosphoserine phosphatase [Moritella viscosa]